MRYFLFFNGILLNSVVFAGSMPVYQEYRPKDYQVSLKENKPKTLSKRSLSLSSSYFHYSSRGLADLSQDLLQGMSVGYDWLRKKMPSPGGRFFKGLLYTTAVVYIYGAYSLVYHEIGHGLRYRANGGTFRLYHKSEDQDDDFSKKRENIFGYWGACFSAWFYI